MGCISPLFMRLRGHRQRPEAALLCGGERSFASSCTVSGQGPMEALHLVENTRNRREKLCLTRAPIGGKTLAFFDSFQSFPGWWRVRGSSELTKTTGELEVLSASGTAVPERSQPTASNGGGAREAQLPGRPKVTMPTGLPPESIRRKGTQVALPCPSACRLRNRQAR